MKVGVIGSGKIGATAARLFADAGYEVVIANSRGPQSLSGLVDELGASVKAGTVQEAASSGELVLVAVPLRAIHELPAAPLAGRIVIDANNYYLVSCRHARAAASVRNDRKISRRSRALYTRASYDGAQLQCSSRYRHDRAWRRRIPVGSFAVAVAGMSPSVLRVWAVMKCAEFRCWEPRWAWSRGVCSLTGSGWGTGRACRRPALPAPLGRCGRSHVAAGRGRGSG